MLLMLSGEGSGDIGACRVAADECEGAEFQPGPMAWLIEKLVEPAWGYSPLDSSAFVFVPEGSLGRYCKANIRAIALPGKQRPQETRFFFKNARGLGRMAKAKTVTAECPVGAVLFHDMDGTRSTPVNEWKAKVRSIEDGFAAEQFDLGVAMVPRPKSEAWLLCAVKENAYQNCEALEDESGNDASPNNLKTQLDVVLQRHGRTTRELPEMIENGTIEALRIKMQSYTEFRTQMEDVASRMLSKRDDVIVERILSQ
jgi:hypothetical protein